MGGTGVATLVRSNVLGAAETAQHKPLGLGSSSLPHHPLGTCPRGAARGLRRQWTTAKQPRGGGGDVSCNVLPFFLDLSLAFAPGMEFFDAVKSSVDSEVVFQATLQVPAHHALACRLNAYGTPFAAPDLQAAAHELRDEDMEFAACLATPPDLDEQLSVNFGRVMSMLEKNQGNGGGQIATRAAQARADAAGGTGASTVQQQLRSTPGTQQQAPKVLVSVDEAESTAAQLQRQNSAKKQPKLQALMDGYGKRALQALLGLGYLLTVLHEKSLGGRIEFSAALTAASIISPTTSDNHLRPRGSSGLGALAAGLRQLMRECPSLSPMSTPSHSLGRRQGAAAALAAMDRANSSGGGGSTSSGSRSAAVPDVLSPRRAAPHVASSFEAAWERVLHPQLNSTGGGSGSFGSRGGGGGGGGGTTARGPIPACQGLQLQLSLSAPCRMRSTTQDGSVTPGSTPRTPMASIQHQGSGYAAAAAFGLSPAGSSTPAAAHLAPRGSPLAKSSGYLQPQPSPQQQRQQAQEEEEDEEELLHKAHDVGRGSSSVDAAIDNAIELLQEQRLEASATDLVAMDDADESAFARAAAAATPADDFADVSLLCTPVRAVTPPAQQQQQQQQTLGHGVRSFYLADQGPVTSPINTAWPPPAAGSAAAGGVKPQTPFGSPWVNVAAAAGARDSSAGGASSSGSNAPSTPTRMLLPVMSMRLTCSPAWQYNNTNSSSSSGGNGEELMGQPRQAADAVGNAGRSGAAAGTQQQQQQEAATNSPSVTLSHFISAADADKNAAGRRPAVHMHQLTREERRQQAQKQQQERDAGNDARRNSDSSSNSMLGSPSASYALPQGLWPTMSFSLVPIRLPPASPKSPQELSTSGASCSA